MSTTPPAGWYDDPITPGARRYWNGIAWGQESATAPTGGALPVAVASAPARAVGVRNGTAVWALVLGIVAVALFWVPLLYLVTSVAGGIVAIVLGNRGRRFAALGIATNRGPATAGLVLGIVGLSLAGLNGLLGAVGGVLRALF